jgi:hypothetical protein
LYEFGGLLGELTTCNSTPHRQYHQLANSIKAIDKSINALLSHCHDIQNQQQQHPTLEATIKQS